MRSLQTDNRVRNGLVGIIIITLVVMVGQAFALLPQLFAKPRYFAEFTDAAGIQPGDKVRITGMDVGTVNSLDIKGDNLRCCTAQLQGENLYQWLYMAKCCIGSVGKFDVVGSFIGCFGVPTVPNET